jgi:hypothetical protein
MKKFHFIILFLVNLVCFIENSYISSIISSVIAIARQNKDAYSGSGGNLFFLILRHFKTNKYN